MPADTAVFVGRQPIFNTHKEVYAYELLYRSGLHENRYTHEDGEAASRRLVDGTLNVMSLDDLVGKRPAFINIPRQFLLEQMYTVLPRERVVLELLETIEPDAEVIAAVKQLKKLGYRLALDDFVFSPAYQPLLALADIVKIDLLMYEPEESGKLAQEWGQRGIMMLAEKVETHDAFHQAAAQGYTLFQGYFFCKPEIVARRELPANKLNYMRFMKEIRQEKVDYQKLEQIIKVEMSLSVRLLRYLNSAAVGLRQKVGSIRQALALMGQGPLRKWASVAAMAGMGDEKPPELIATCLTRGRFCELAGVAAGMKGRELDLFFLGLFSGADALMDQPLEELLPAMAVSDQVITALLGGDSELGEVYRLALAMERSNVTVTRVLCGRLGLDLELTMEMYREAVKWVEATGGLGKD